MSRVRGERDLERRVTEALADLGAQGEAAGEAELELDSMARLDLLATLEQRFGVELAEDAVQELRSIPRIAAVVREAILAGGDRSEGEPEPQNRSA
ncbi:MAG: phosphopantetheine-binding protein [Polyangia bacterium]